MKHSTSPVPNRKPTDAARGMACKGTRVGGPRLHVLRQPDRAGPLGGKTRLPARRLAHANGARPGHGSRPLPGRGRGIVGRHLVTALQIQQRARQRMARIGDPAILEAADGALVNPHAHGNGALAQAARTEGLDDF